MPVTLNSETRVDLPTSTLTSQPCAGGLLPSPSLALPRLPTRPFLCSCSGLVAPPQWARWTQVQKHIFTERFKSDSGHKVRSW